MDSIEGKSKQFANALNTMWNDTLNSDLIKIFIDLGTGLIKMADGIDVFGTKIGNMWTTVGILVTLIIKKMTKLSWGEFFTSIGTSITGLNTKLVSLAARFGLVSTTATTANKALDNLTAGELRNAMATYGVDKANREAMLSQMGLAGATKDQIIAQGQLTASTLEEAVANKVLTQTQAEKLAAYYGLKLSTIGLTSANAAHILTEAGVDREQKKRIITALGLTMETKTLTREEFINALAAKGVGDANERAAWATLFFGEANKKLNFSFKSLGNGIKNFITKNSLLITLALAAAAIVGIIALFKSWITTLEESEEKLTDLNSALESTESKLDDLEGQLKEVQDRMKELNEQESLTFVEQEELDKLRAQNAELERQIDLTKQTREAQQKEVNNQALKTARRYKDANFKSGKGKGEYQETGANVGGVIGGVAGGVGAGIGVAAASSAATAAAAAGGAKILGAIGTFLGGPIGTALGVGLGALIGGLIVGGIGSAVGGAVADAQNQVGDAMDDMLAQRKKLEEEYNKAQAAYAKNPTKKKVVEEYEEAEEALANYDSMMSEHISKLDSYYSQIDLSVYDPTLDKQKIEDLRKEMNDFYDTQDKWAIANGGQDAKYNAITRIFGENASQELKRIKKEIELAANDAVKTAKETGEELKFDVDLSEYMNPADLEAFTARLHDMGLYVYEVENYFKDMAQAEKEAAKISLYGVATDINKITEGLDNLKGAFDEVLESGSVTAKTLTELNEVFGDLGDSWDNYVNTMFSGVSSTKEMQEATEALAKAFIDSKILTGEAISEYERMTYIIQLRNLGVTNAEEYVDDKIEENAYKAIQNSATYDKDELLGDYTNATDEDKKALKDKYGIVKTDFYEMSPEELEKMAEYFGESKKINADTAQKIADEYGLEIDNLNEVVDLLQDKIDKEKELADLQNQQGDYNDWLNGEGGYNQLNEKKDQIGVELNTPYKNLPYSDNIIELIESLLSNEGLSADNLEYAKYNSSLQIRDDKGRLTAWTNIAQVTPEEFQQIQELLELREKLFAEGEEKGYIVDGKIIDPEYQKKIDEVQSDVDEFKNQIETELTADVKLKLELQGKSDLVDEMQEIYDTLADAEKEYNENGGYVSVDTLQSLLKLKPKYLDMLYDENGQLNLNKQTLLQVAQARTLDMGIQAAQNVITAASEALEANKIDRLRELTEVTYGQADANWALVDSNLATLKSTIETRNADTKDEMYGQLSGVYEGIESQVLAIKDLTNRSVANIGNSFSSSDNTTKAAAESALEKLQKRYERKIKNIEGQQTYLENEVERLEALNQGASVDYYKEQIALEDKKLDLLEQERAELLKLEMNDEVADALWEVEHALQESVLAAIDFGKAMHDAQMEAVDGISEAYDAMETISSNRMQNLELYKDGLEINGEYASEGLYNEMIRLADEDVTRDEKKLKDLLGAIDEYRNMENPFEKGTDEYDGFEADRDKNIVELHAQAAETKNNIREGVNKVNQLREDMKDTYIEAWDGITEAFDNVGSFLQNQMDFIDAYEDRLSTLNINIPDFVYREKISTQKNIVSNLDKELAEGYKLLNDYEAKYGASDKRYTEKLQELTELESQRYQEETKIIEFEQQIFDNQIDRFNQVVDRINDATQRLQNISDLIGDEDVATEDGEWTDEGLTRLGMAHQQMAYNKQAAEEYAEKMEEVTDSYNKGEISEKKYYETMKELSDGQWDAINAYEDMKDSIVELEEARIDMIEEGLDKEIEAYSELIELKKEELDAERDLFDFKKNIEKQTKDIAALERRIASMGGSTDASTIAERTKLEAELRNAKDELDGTYRDHAYDSMGRALDDELDAYTKSSEDYIKSLRESIKDTDLIIEQTYQKVLENTDIVLQTITTKANEYGFYIDEDLTAPWENAQTEALDLETSAISHIDNIYDKVNSVTSTLTANVTQPWKDGKRDLLLFSEEVPRQLDLMLQKAKNNQTAILNTTKDFVGQMKGQIDLIPTYADSAATRMLETAKQNVKDINAEYAKITYSSYEGGPTGGGNPTVTNPTGGNPGSGYITGENVKTLQKILNQFFNAGLSEPVDGIYGPATTNAVRKMKVLLYQDAGHTFRQAEAKADGKYDFEAKAMLQNYLNKRNVGSWFRENKLSVPAAMYAKGTMSTTHDQLAITDESWIGEEITLAAGKNGQLQYLKKGSAVMPADISANLVEWGKLNPNMMGITNMTDGINLMSNYINKPEIKVDVENFLNVGTVSRDTLPELEKLMDKKIDTFAKQLNASIRKFK